mmetsp:Transcript_17450/g.31483  ORF Transcript_17450/g.31483 Transcript_17450/m.31483 type:complete len:346 (+) Transcript_17450:84-1121(+)
MCELARERIENFKALSAQMKLMEAQLRDRPDAELDASTLQRSYDQLLKQLETALQNCVQRAQGQMASQTRLLEASVDSAAFEGQRQVPAKAKSLGTNTTLRWNTHKAYVVRDGDWPERGMNMAKDVSAEVMSSLDSHWVEKFNTAPDVAAQLETDICSALQAVVNQFSETLEEWPQLQEHASTLGSTVIESVQSHLELHLRQFDRMLQDCRKGYGEEVIEDTQTQLPDLLEQAKYLSGTGSANVRKEMVTKNLKKVNLTSAVEKPKARCQRVAGHFQTVAGAMTASCMTEASHCFSPLWESRDFQPEKEREAKATFRDVLGSHVSTVTAALEAACAAWPSEAGSS